MARCETAAPLGRPVEPDVKMQYARSSGSTCAWAPVAGRSHSSTDSTSTVVMPGRLAGNTPRSTIAPVVTMTRSAASSIMPSRRCLGYSGSRGTYAPPAFRMPSTATNSSNERSRQMPTRVSRPTPSLRRREAIASARRLSSPYDIRPASKSSAVTSGDACASDSNI